MANQSNSSLLFSTYTFAFIKFNSFYLTILRSIKNHRKEIICNSNVEGFLLILLFLL